MIQNVIRTILGEVYAIAVSHARQQVKKSPSP